MLARIRTVKPDFFRHEKLQDLEAENPAKCPMLVFAGLWGHCDKAGRFLWRPRTLKLDILPFLPFDMAETLGLLVSAGFIERYAVDGVDYAWIPSFEDHQRINGKESQEPEKYPEPPEKQAGSVGEATETTGREGKGREGKGVVDQLSLVASPLGPILPSNIPYSEIIALYNRIMTGLPKVKEKTQKRRLLIRAAWTASKRRQTLKFWEAYFEECNEDEFLNGTGPYGKGHENWTPTFDFLMRQDQIVKVYEKAMHRVERAA